MAENRTRLLCNGCSRRFFCSSCRYCDLRFCSGCDRGDALVGGTCTECRYNRAEAEEAEERERMAMEEAEAAEAEAVEAAAAEEEEGNDYY